MQGGRKPLSETVKNARGTNQPSRARDEVKVPNTAPTMPAYLSPAAKKIWKEELPRVISAGVVDSDSSLFARYCSVEALVRQLFTEGTVPMGNLLTELRRMGEALGLTGPSSRVARATKEPETNPFAAFTGPKLVS